MNASTEQKKFIFAVIFDMANKLQVVGDRFLSNADMTTKQWLMTLAVDQYGERTPTLGDVARQLGTSHQNAKQIALKLKSKGYLEIEKDIEDARTLRLSITDKSREFWAGRETEDLEFISGLFDGLSQNELQDMFSGFQKLYKNVKELHKQTK